MDLYKYRRRLKKETSMQGMEESTKLIVNETFHEAPNYKDVFLNGIKFDARVSVDEDETECEILFRPDTSISKGDVITIEESHWLVNNTYNNSIYPTAYVDLCNEWLRWTNEFGEIVVYPCVVKATSRDIDIEEGKYLTYSETSANILIQYNQDTKTIKVKQRFILNGLPYEIIGIDQISNVIQGLGFIEMRAEQALIQAEDNLEEEIADNTNNAGWGEW